MSQKSIAFGLVSILVIFCWTTLIFAVPRFAARENVLCSHCHVNPDGGGLRNDYGAGYYSRKILPMDHWGAFGSDKFTTQLNDFIRYGADVRAQYFRYADNHSSSQAVFPMQTDIYFGVNPSDKLHFYLETSLLQSVAASEVWGQLNILPANGYLRIGQFLPAYGLRLADHTAFIRGGNVGGLVLPDTLSGGIAPHQGLQWTPQATTDGIEIGLQPSNYIVTASFGKARNNPDYSLSLNLAHVFYINYINFLIGASAFHGNYYVGLKPYTYVGGYLGVNWNQFTFLGEIDVTKDYSGKGITGLAAYSELGITLFKGFTAFTQFQVYDADINLTGQSLNQYAIGVDIFPMAYLQIQPQYRIMTTAADKNYQRTELLCQVHFWF